MFTAISATVVLPILCSCCVIIVNSSVMEYGFRIGRCELGLSANSDVISEVFQRLKVCFDRCEQKVERNYRGVLWCAGGDRSGRRAQRARAQRRRGDARSRGGRAAAAGGAVHRAARRAVTRYIYITP